MNIWPFKRRQPAPKPKSWEAQFIGEMLAWRGIGESFEYLGRHFVVTGYYEFFPHPLGINVRVRLSADYADDLGVIRNAEFSPPEVKALMARQP